MSNLPESSGLFRGQQPPAPPWWWRLEDGEGREVEVADVGRPEFPSQGDAESWVGESWEQLLESGVDAVTLFEGDREVYGPMSLRPA